MIVSRILVLEFHRGLLEPLSELGVDDRIDLVGVLVIARKLLVGEESASSRDIVRGLRGSVLLAVGRLE
jgi:hypothetical protein